MQRPTTKSRVFIPALTITLQQSILDERRQHGQRSVIANITARVPTVERTRLALVAARDHVVPNAAAAARASAKLDVIVDERDAAVGHCQVGAARMLAAHSLLIETAAARAVHVFWICLR